eukprot:GHRR01006177.1.p1 GENE.GHRR01006177.1~~GHRR01006177.1.p1  ORF type:complete len:198 (+),score=52.31 GHRR01006177.1:3314-3907(+)
MHMPHAIDHDEVLRVHAQTVQPLYFMQITYIMCSQPVHTSRACHMMQDLLDALFDVKSIPRHWSILATTAFVCSNVTTSLFVKDLGQVLHMLGGTAASLMIFCLPGLLLMNAAIIKHTNSFTDLSQLADEEPGSDIPSQAPSEDGLPRPSTPLLHKKAGIRDAGLIFAPGKSWVMGLLLVMISGVVLAVTVVTAALG